MKAFLLSLAIFLSAAANATLKADYGHYYATSYQDNQTTNIKTLCSTPGVTGINVRQLWGDTEPTEGSYVWTKFDAVLSTIGTMGAATGSGGNRVANSTCKVWLFVTTRAYSTDPNAQPCPTWLKDSHGLPGWSANSESTTYKGVIAATNATPIVIQTGTFNNGTPVPAAHGFSTGDSIFIDLVHGNTNANGNWTITVVDSTHFSLNGSHGNAAYSGQFGSATKGGAFTCKIFDSTVQTKFQTLLGVMGGRYDGNANVEGVTFQETSLAFDSPWNQDSGAGGFYVGPTFTSQLISMNQACATDFPTSRCMQFTNFILGDNNGLKNLSNAITAIPFNQACLSGPDILPHSASLTGVGKIYPVMASHVGCRADSAQNNSFKDAGCTVQSGCIFNFAVSGTFGSFNSANTLAANNGLCLNSYIFWNDSSTEQAAANPQIKANPYGIGWYGQCICGGGPP